MTVDDRESEPARADGGTTASPFDVVSEVEETRREKVEKVFDTYVRAPFLVIWNDWRARVGLFIIAVYLLMGTVGVMVVDKTFVTEGPPLVQPFQTMKYPLGTDDMGRDIFARLVHSTPQILQMMFAGAATTVLFGMLVGSIAGYRGGLVDTVLSSITDVFINLPGYPLVMVLSLTLPPKYVMNPYAVGMLISVTAWGGLARKMRSQVLTLREESFVEASRAMGISSYLIVAKDVVPHLMPYAMINLASTARRVIFTAAGLYFLGVLPYGDPNWGVMLNRAYQDGAFYRPNALHWFLAPALTIVIIGSGLILLSQSLDRVFNPRVRARHEKHTETSSGVAEHAGGSAGTDGRSGGFGGATGGVEGGEESDDE